MILTKQTNSIRRDNKLSVNFLFENYDYPNSEQEPLTLKHPKNRRKGKQHKISVSLYEISCCRWFPKKSVLHLYALASLALDYTVTPKSKQMLFFICIVEVLWSHNFYTVSSDTISINIEGENLIFFVKLYIISFKYHFSLFSTQMTKFSHIKMKCALEK